LGIIALLYYDRWEAGNSVAFLDGLEILRYFFVVYLDDVEPNLISEFSRESFESRWDFILFGEKDDFIDIIIIFIFD
jgi:hypothetical protein